MLPSSVTRSSGTRPGPAAPLEETQTGVTDRNIFSVVPTVLPTQGAPDRSEEDGFLSWLIPPFLAPALLLPLPHPSSAAPADLCISRSAASSPPLILPFALHLLLHPPLWDILLVRWVKCGRAGPPSPTGSAELDDLAPLGDGVVPVGLLGRRLHSHRVLGPGAEEPVAPDGHGQRNRFGHQLGGDVLDTRPAAGFQNQQQRPQRRVGSAHLRPAPTLCLNLLEFLFSFLFRSMK